MVNDGILDRCDSQEVYGMHNMPFYPVGVLAVRPAALLAAADELEAIIQGQGGHAAARTRRLTAAWRPPVWWWPCKVLRPTM